MLTAYRERLDRIVESAKGGRAATSDDLTGYKSDPVGFARKILGVEPTPDQRAILSALYKPPYRVMAKSGHNVGKTFVAAVAAVHKFYTNPKSVVMTTAPTERDVIDLLWTEIRLLVARGRYEDGRPLPDFFTGPAAPAMFDNEEHWAKGYTARKGESFQGRHRENMLFIFDEAEGVDATYWKTTGTMFQPDGTHGWLAIFNPTTTTSQSYQEERSVDAAGERKWNVLSISSLDHPNVADALAGRAAGIPNAVSIDQVWGWLGEWFEESNDPDPEQDVEFPPASGRWWRPSPDGESRVLGRRPSAGTFGVWSERLWALACRLTTPALVVPAELPQVGCDVARFGDDRTEMHARVGAVSLHHEDHGGWDTVRTADRLMALADEYAAFANGVRGGKFEPWKGRDVPLAIDDTGVGGGVTDICQSRRYNAMPVNAGCSALDATHYPRVRDELWFTVRDRARKGTLDLSRLGRKRLAKLEVQALAPTWKPTPDRRRQVESKEDVKKRLGRSPDGMDALNLAYLETGSDVPTAVVGTGRAATLGRGERVRR